MPKPEWGVKRLCPECGERYYDMLRDPIICPHCATPFEVAVKDKSAALKSDLSRAQKAGKKAAEESLVDDEDEAIVDDTESDDADEALLEDDDDDAASSPALSDEESDDEPVAFEDEVLLDDDDDEDDDAIDDIGDVKPKDDSET